MSIEKDSLPVPDAAISDPECREVVRAWVANNGLHCSMRVLQWQPHVWGIVLSDIVRHVVEAEVEERGADAKKVTRTIVDKFMDEMCAFGEEIDASAKPKS